MWLWMSDCILFIARLINIHGSSVRIALCGCCMAGATWNAAVSAQVLCTPFNHAPWLQCHFIQSHIGRVYVCLGVTCRLHFWQNDRDLLRATAVTRGWSWDRNKSQYRKLTLEKNILLPLLPGLEPGTFRSRVRRSNHWAIPALQLRFSNHRLPIQQRRSLGIPRDERIIMYCLWWISLFV